MDANGISPETTLALEYVRAIIPPTYSDSYEHDDWVSSVDVLSGASSATKQTSLLPVPGQEKIVSGSYDGLVRVWNTSSQILAISPPAERGGHSSAVKAAKFIDASHISSAGLDRCVRVWKLDTIETSQTQASLQPQIELYGHKASIDSIATHGVSNRLLTASADHNLGLWSTRKSDAPEAPSSLVPASSGQSAKRRRLASAVATPQRGPLTMLRGHTAPVSDTIFAPHDRTVAYSTSWDHTLKTWDLTTSVCVDTRSTSQSLFAVTALPAVNLVATGTSARHITLIDPRASATTVSTLMLRGHTNAVVSLATDPTNGYGLVSGSHDGTCRLWDVRSSRSEKDGRVGESTYVIDRESARTTGKRGPGEASKVFQVCWDESVGIVSAGEDKRVQINQGRSSSGKEDSN